MANTSHDETDEADSTNVVLENSEKAPTGTSLYSKALRALEEHEFANPVAIQFMINNISKLEAENTELKKYRNKFYESESNLRVQKERTGLSATSKNISTALLSASSAGAGIVTSFMAVSRLSVLLFAVFVVIAASSFFIKIKDAPDA